MCSSKNLYLKIYHAILPIVNNTQECKSITKLILNYYFNYDMLAIALGKDWSITKEEEKVLVNVIQRLKKHEPIQYILGEAHFLGRCFTVTPDVFIPRPETEEMVHYIIQENQSPGLKIIDIGTGSGCIAITLKKVLEKSGVYALDIAENALKVARENARKFDAKVHFIQADIFSDAPLVGQWDIMVSNPPYVRLSEQKLMPKNVLHYEPPQALFVEDDKPLIFYTQIVALAKTHLKRGGKVYLEINEAFGKTIADLLRYAGFEKVSVKQDLQGKDRWVIGTLDALF